MKTKTNSKTKARLVELQDAHDEMAQALEFARRAIRGIPEGKAQALLLRYANEVACSGSEQHVSKFRDFLSGAVTMLHEQGFITERAWCDINNAAADLSHSVRNYFNVLHDR